MILQELIRNIVIYKEVVKPLLKTWQGYILIHHIFSKAQKRQAELMNTIKLSLRAPVLQPLSDTGTLTITSQKLVLLNDFLKNEAESSQSTATISNNCSIVLMVDGLAEDIADKGKSHNLICSTGNNTTTFIHEEKNIKTTGFFYV